MKIMTLFILLTALPGIASAQPETGPGLPEQEPPARAPGLTGLTACPHCNQAEQLLIDLNYYKQVLTILEQIHLQRSNIDPELLQSLHAVLMKTRPDLGEILSTKPEPERKPAKSTQTAKPAKTAKKARKTAKSAALKPVKKPAPRKGIEGLVVGHVNEGNKALGIQPSIVLVKDGRPFSLTIGATIEHNRRTYKILKADFIKDPQKGNRHEVHLQDQNSKKTHIVPWQ